MSTTSTCPSRALIEDTRQQAAKHDHKNGRWASAGVSIVRSKLPFGDYAYAPKAAVDTKKDLYELCGNLTSEHARFRRECVHARESGCALVVLVENDAGIRSNRDLASWIEPEKHYQMRVAKSGNRRAKRWSGKTIAATCKTMNERYGVIFDFCAPDESADRILRILDYYEGVGRDEPEASSD